MDKKYKITGVIVLGLVFLGVAGWYLHRTTIPVLEPKGPVAAKELHLMIIATLLMLIVVVPVFVLTFYIVWKYRETNPRKAKYSPNWDHSRIAETIWWLIPSLLILVLSIITWQGTQQLDPYKPLVSSTPAIDVQVVALDWRWLFIYPQQHIASINFVQFPKNTPVHFYITADAPMNSFWIPQLSGQMYAMAGMQTQLNLSASSYGDFTGRSANISGKGFAGMVFTARSSSASAFASWVSHAQQSGQQLTADTYQSLSQPTENSQVAYYRDPQANLFNDIMLQYAVPGSTVASLSTNPRLSQVAAMSGMEMQ